MTAAKAPLRKIVGYVEVSPDWYHEKLECGHTKPIVRDIYGETNAVRRRCHKCRREAEAKTLKLEQDCREYLQRKPDA